jgi:DNA-binding response OmpR family regulator
MKPSIYMVDDEPDFQTIIHSWLEPAYDVLSLKDGLELQGALRAKAPDLVMLDLNLPGEDGFEVCKRLRTTPGLEQVPILFLTASRESRDYCENLTCGGSGYITKPVGRQQLLSAVDELLSEHRTKQTADAGGSD